MATMFGLENWIIFGLPMRPALTAVKVAVFGASSATALPTPSRFTVGLIPLYGTSIDPPLTSPKFGGLNSTSKSQVFWAQ